MTVFFSVKRVCDTACISCPSPSSDRGPAQTHSEAAGGGLRHPRPAHEPPFPTHSPNAAPRTPRNSLSAAGVNSVNPCPASNDWESVIPAADETEINPCARIRREEEEEEEGGGQG